MIESAELWKPIPMLRDHYDASNRGRIRSRFHYRSSGHKVRILTPYRYPSGYLGVTVHYGGAQNRHYVHRLVAMAFLDGSGEVNHIDGDKGNNHLANLEWVTPKENTAHAWRNGLLPPPPVGVGEANGRARISDTVALEIRRRLDSGEGATALARSMGVSANTVFDIKRRRRWQHLWTDQAVC